MSSIVKNKIEQIYTIKDDYSKIDIRKGYPILIDADMILPTIKLKVIKDYIKIDVIRQKNNKRYSTTIGRFILNISDKYLEVDHINRNTLDNRRCNLRIVTKAQNAWNKEKKSSVNEFKGYSIKKDEIRVRCTKEGIRYVYSMHIDKCSELEAAILYDCMSISLHGEYGCRNFLNTYSNEQVNAILQKYDRYKTTEIHKKNKKP